VYDTLRLMIICSKCGREDSRGTVIFTAVGDVSYCKFCKPRVFREPDKVQSVFADGFQLQHVRGDDGKPVTVHSVKELRQVEKKHNVALAIMSDDRIGGPPQHDPDAGNLVRGYKKKWNRDPDAYRPENITGVSTGIAKSASDTLVDAPNPLNH
jgi:hypothetical protein